MRTSDERMVGDNVKKRITTILRAILILTLVIVGTCLIIFQIVKKEEESKGLTFYLPRSTSFASNWNYEMNDTGVLKEVESGRYCSLTKYYDYWRFEPIKSGEVTLYFIAQYQTEEVTEDSFSITYCVDENLQITEINSNNKPEKINFDDDALGLVMLKFSDFCYIHIGNLFVKIIDIFDFLFGIFI